MCELCKAALDKYWPDLDTDDRSTLLLEATAFPFSSGEHTAKQIKEIAERSGTDFRKAMALAYEDLDKEMAKFRKREKEAGE